MQIPDAEKDQRESYKASDLDRYTTIKTEGPRYYRVCESSAVVRFRSEHVYKCTERTTAEKIENPHFRNVVWHTHIYTCRQTSTQQHSTSKNKTGITLGNHEVVPPQIEMTRTFEIWLFRLSPPGQAPRAWDSTGWTPSLHCVGFCSSCYTLSSQSPEGPGMYRLSLGSSLSALLCQV